jgi:hypothetical protein
MSNSNDSSDSVTGQEILLFFILLVMMRGCYHVGAIAEKVNSEEYATEPLADPDPTANGLHPFGFQPILQ